MHEAEEQAPCFPFFLPGFQTPNSSFDPAGEESARGGPACVPGEVRTQGPPSETQPSPLSPAFALGSPWQGPRMAPCGLLCCLPAVTTQVSTSRAGKMWASESPH